MNMKKSNVLLGLLFFFAAFNLNAQSLMLSTTPDKVVQEGEVFSIDVKVKDFTNIISCQFAIFWDANVLQYIGVNNHSLPDVTSENVNPMFSNEGMIRFNWVTPDPSFAGFSLNDNMQIFTISFKAIGGPAMQSMVEISGDDNPDNPFPVEFIDEGDMEVPVNITSGTVTIDGVNASKETVTQDFTLFQNNPNPFRTQTNISFNLNQSSQTQLSIRDQAGKVVYETNGSYTSGLHTIQLSRDLFTSAGSYFFTLKTENATATRQLVVQ
jgi:hypothetical protein